MNREWTRALRESGDAGSGSMRGSLDLAGRRTEV